MSYRRIVTKVLVVAAALTLIGGTAQAAQRETPTQPNIVAAAVYSLAHPTSAPHGANDWDCKPSAAHPYPVLLSNGTTTNAYEDWAGLSPKLAAAGYCVFAVNLGGIPGTFLQTVGPIADTTAGLAAFGDRVLAATGASKLDIVGHSQGGMNPRYWIKYLGGADRIHKLIGLSPSNYGTDLYGFLTAIQAIPPLRSGLGVVCQSCNEQAIGSPFLTKLNAGGDTVPGVEYTVIQTTYDDVVTPYTGAFLKPAANVHNVLLQDSCPADLTDHLAIPYDPIAQQLVLNTLDPSSATTPNCALVPPVIG